MAKKTEKTVDPLIIILSNRGPFSFQQKEDGSFVTERGTGGLVTALGALAAQHDVLWGALAMQEGDRAWIEANQGAVQTVENIKLRLLTVDPEQYSQYYNQISNPLLWFIQHQLWDIPRTPDISQETWQAWEEGYVAVNRYIAEAIAVDVEAMPAERPVIILPQDYHLYLVPRFLRERLGDRVQIQPFLHIPWPGPDAWRILPGTMRTAILTSLLASDRVGFQTQKDAFNFVQTCRFYLNDAHSRGSRDTIHYQGRAVKAKAYPISIDVEKVLTMAEEPQTQLLKSQLLNITQDRQVILRVDRVEPSKNILRGLKAYEDLLERYPEHRGRVQMLALLVPSRLSVNEYQDYLSQIMATAGLINARYSESLWEPVRTILGENYYRAIAAMQLYDVLLVNPIADGMNLVAKEGVVINQRNGVLLLSEYAGASYELGDKSVSLSPFDTYGTAEAMHQALTMSADDRREQADALRARVMAADIKHWFHDQLQDSLQASASHVKKAATSSTPATKQSAAAPTPSGMSGD